MGGILARLATGFQLVFILSGGSQGLCHIGRGPCLSDPAGGAWPAAVPWTVLGGGILAGFYSCNVTCCPGGVLVALLSLAEYVRGFVLTGFPECSGDDLCQCRPDHLGGGSWPVGAEPDPLLIPLVLVLVMLGPKQAVVGVMHACNGAGGDGGGHMIDETPAPPVRCRCGLCSRILISEINGTPAETDHLVRLMELSRRSGDEASDLYPDLIVWPETAFAGFISDERVVFDAVTGAASGGMSTLLTGALRLEGQQILSFFNTAALISPDGSLTATYDKQHLVPFGEYAPLRQYLPFVDAIAGPADFTPGQGKAAMAMQRRDGTTVSILPLICFEVIFPAAVRDAVLAEDIDLLVTITNDAWFGDTIGPRQHLAMARMRSAELGLPMLRAANTGISSVIDARGREVARLGYGQDGTINTSLGGVVDTPYRRSGETGFVLLLLILAVMAGHYQGLTALLLRR